MRVDQRRRTDTTFRATRLEPDRRMLIDGVSAPYQADYILTPIPAGGTLLSFRFRIARLDLFLLPFERLIREELADGADRTAHNLKSLIEPKADDLQFPLSPPMRARPDHHPEERR